MVGCWLVVGWRLVGPWLLGDGVDVANPLLEQPCHGAVGGWFEGGEAPSAEVFHGCAGLPEHLGTHAGSAPPKLACNRIENVVY